MEVEEPANRGEKRGRRLKGESWGEGKMKVKEHRKLYPLLMII